MIQGYPASDFDLDERTRLAIEELQATIIAQYPTATFELAWSPDDEDSLLLLATADVDDPDEVGDLVLDRVVSLIADEGIYVHVIPLRTPERIQASWEAERQEIWPRQLRLSGVSGSA